jgi:hypothetical protein
VREGNTALTVAAIEEGSHIHPHALAALTTVGLPLATVAATRLVLHPSSPLLQMALSLNTHPRYAVGSVGKRARCALRTAFLLSLVGPTAGWCQAPSSSGPPPAAFSTIPPSAVSMVSLRPLWSVSLGRNAAERPGEVTFAIALGDRYIVADNVKRQLLIYNADGSLRRRAAGWGDSDGDIQSPVQLLAYHDTVLVVDLTHRHRIHAFDRDGRFLGARFAALGEAYPSSMAIGASVAAFAHANAEDRPGRAAVSITDLRGKELANGCPSAEAYRQSEQRRGMLAHFTERLVSIRANRVYCAQTVTPVVAVLDLNAATIGTIAVAPPFYLGPGDRSESQNRKALLDFQATWTQLTDFYPTARGFVEVYAQYDVAAGRYRFRLFACDYNGRPSNCRGGELPGRPMRLTSADTLLTVQSHPNGSVSLDLLAMER